MQLELETFISESLLQVHSALKNVNNELTKNYPVNQKKNIFLLKPGAAKQEGQGIHFDLAITTKTETSAKGKAKSRIWVVEGGLGAEHHIINESISRISFTVHVTKFAGTFTKPLNE